MIGIEANEKRREPELSSQEHIIFMHFLPHLPNKEVPSLYKALLAPLRQRVTLNHPGAHVEEHTLDYGGKRKPGLSSEANLESLMHVCYHRTLEAAHSVTSLYKHRPLIQYTFFWLCDEPESDGNREPECTPYFEPYPWGYLDYYSELVKLDLRMFVIAREGQSIPDEMLRRCWPIPPETLLPPTPPRLVEDSQLDKEMEVLNLTGLGSGSDFVRMKTYQFGAIGSSKHQAYFQLWESVLGDDPVIYLPQA